MMDNLLGGDEDEDPDESSADNDMDGGLFDGEEGGGDDDLMGGGDDDLMGGGDDEMAFDDMDDGGTATSAEMDNRIEELENEVASLSSTVNTVKSENEQISESVQEVEENIRKLLEVYEMVTRGVNPFVDENEMGDAFGGGGGGDDGGSSMSLFGDDEDETADVDDSVANADADEFFDDDFDDFDEEESGDDFDDFDEDDGFEDDGFGDDDFDEDGADGDDEDDDSGGKSFEELKAEYESGDADWDDDESADEEADDETDEPAIDEGPVEDIDDEPLETEAEAIEGLEDDGDEFEDFESTTDPDTATAEDSESVETVTEEGTEPPVTGGKPYLETLPSGYVADIVVMDWLEFLVEETGIDGAARTIAYYEAIEWIDEPAAETLQTFLNGFGGEVKADPEPRSSLTVEHHNASLRFISRIVNPDMEMVSFNGTSTSDRARPGSKARGPAAGRNNQSGRSTPPDRYGGGQPQRRQGVEPDGGQTVSERSKTRERATEEKHIEEPSDGFNWGSDQTK